MTRRKTAVRLSRLKLLHNQAARFMHQLLDNPALSMPGSTKSRGYGREMAARWTVGWMPRNTDIFLNWARDAFYREGIVTLRYHQA